MHTLIPKTNKLAIHTIMALYKINNYGCFSWQNIANFISVTKCNTHNHVYIGEVSQALYVSLFEDGEIKVFNETNIVHISFLGQFKYKVYNLQP